MDEVLDALAWIECFHTMFEESCEDYVRRMLNDISTGVSIVTTQLSSTSTTTTGIVLLISIYSVLFQWLAEQFLWFIFIPEPSADCHCGLAKRNTKIVGGKEAGVNEYPWQVGFKEKNKSYFFCGGALISNRWILSAAHCFCCSEGDADPAKYEAVLGEHDYKDITETKHVIKNIELILNHPKYEQTDFYINFDFALIKMKTTLDFSLHERAPDSLLLVYIELDRTQPNESA